LVSISSDIFKQNIPACTNSLPPLLQTSAGQVGLAGRIHWIIPVYHFVGKRAGAGPTCDASAALLSSFRAIHRTIRYQQSGEKTFFLLIVLPFLYFLAGAQKIFIFHAVKFLFG
jgi:hypothetical protein